MMMTGPSVPGAHFLPFFRVLRRSVGVPERDGSDRHRVMLWSLRAVMVIPRSDQSPVVALGAGTIGEGSGSRPSDHHSMGTAVA